MATDIGALAGPPPAYTPEFTYVRGQYTIGNESLAYYSVGMEVQDAIKHLILPRDVVLDPLAPIKMAELFQRELNEERVTDPDGLIPYLKQPHQPKFFNSITVVVLPVDPDKEPSLAHRYIDLQDRPPVAEDDQLEPVDIGPVRLRRLIANKQIGYISWDSRLGRAVIVDGQHRFFSVSELMRDPDFPHRRDLSRTALSVLFLVLDPRAGFETDGEAPSVLQTCRAIFIDLNKHAVKVSDARQYLLDDRDLTAVSMRKIMSDEVGGSTDSVADRVLNDQKYPLALIDWASEEARFDREPYVTTVLTLYEEVDVALGLYPPSASDYEAQRDYIDTLTARLELDDVPDFDVKELHRAIDRAEEKSMPFGLSNAAIGAAAEGFRRTVGSLIVRPLVGIEPYAHLIRRYEEAELLSGRFEQWLGLDQKGKNAFVDETKEDPSDIAREIWSEDKANARLAFQVVFQKAFLQALVEMDDYRVDVLEAWGQDGDASRESFVEEWIRRFNLVFAPHLNRNETWQGAGISATGTISWVQASQRAIAGFVIYGLLAPLSEWKDLSPGDVREAAIREWLEEAWAKTGRGRAADSIDGLLKHGGPWRRSVMTYVKAVFRLTEEDRPPEDADFLDHGVRQLNALVPTSS